MPLFPLFLADDLTQREKRAEQHKSNKPAVEISRSAKKNLLMAGLVILALGIILGGMAANQAKASECPGHWHSSFQVVINGQLVDYSSRTYDLSGGGGSPGRLPLSYHMHQPNSAQIHWEPVRGGCEKLDTFMRAVDTDVDADQIVLDGGHEATGMAGTYADDGNNTVRAFRSTDSEDGWTEISVAKLMGAQPSDGERALIVYGSYTDEQIEAFQQRVPFPSGAAGTSMG